jgi:phospholipase/carboxylesterase
VTNPHLSAPELFGAPVANARIVAILLHGRTQDPHQMNDHIVRRLALDDLAYVAPAAEGRTWYPKGFLEPFADNEPRLSFALERLGQLCDEYPRAVMIGFSQGACLASEYVYRSRTRPPRALIAFTGGLLGPPRTTWDETPSLRIPIMISGSVSDPFVPLFRMRESAAAFAKLGAEVTTQFHEAGARHEVSDAEIQTARALLAAL